MFALTGLSTNAMKDYPELIRRIKFIDGETGKRLVFLTNNMQADAVTITQVYKNRWHVELFFKWIKQHLCIKRFYGRSDNAVRSQIWITMCVYLDDVDCEKTAGSRLLRLRNPTNIKRISIHQIVAFAVVFE